MGGVASQREEHNEMKLKKSNVFVDSDVFEVELYMNALMTFNLGVKACTKVNCRPEIIKRDDF